MQSDRERCEAAGCTGFLTKPIDIDKLLAMLAEILPLDDSPIAPKELALPVSTTGDVPAGKQSLIYFRT